MAAALQQQVPHARASDAKACAGVAGVDSECQCLSPAKLSLSEIKRPPLVRSSLTLLSSRELARCSNTGSDLRASLWPSRRPRTERAAAPTWGIPRSGNSPIGLPINMNITSSACVSIRSYYQRQCQYHYQL